MEMKTYKISVCVSIEGVFGERKREAVEIIESDLELGALYKQKQKETKKQLEGEYMRISKLNIEQLTTD